MEGMENTFIVKSNNKYYRFEGATKEQLVMGLVASANQVKEDNKDTFVLDAAEDTKAVLFVTDFETEQEAEKNIKDYSTFLTYVKKKLNVAA